LFVIFKEGLDKEQASLVHSLRLVHDNVRGI
jgi:hypothetical protein